MSEYLSLSLLAFNIESVTRLDVLVDPIDSLNRMRVDDTIESSSPEIHESVILVGSK